MPGSERKAATFAALTNSDSKDSYSCGASEGSGESPGHFSFDPARDWLFHLKAAGDLIRLITNA